MHGWERRPVEVLYEGWLDDDLRETDVVGETEHGNGEG